MKHLKTLVFVSWENKSESDFDQLNKIADSRFAFYVSFAIIWLKQLRGSKKKLITFLHKYKREKKLGQSRLKSNTGYVLNRIYLGQGLSGLP